MRFSIVTPSYNQARFIEKTIQSVLKQRYPDFEHIIIDGGSTDGTIEILKKYPHLRWKCERDRGQADAINKGLRMATGEILAWINSDDYYLPGAFERVARAYQDVGSPAQAGKPDIVFGDVLVVTEADRVIARRRALPYDYRMLLLGTNYIQQPALFFNRRALEEVGYLDETLHYALDWDMWLRFGKAGMKFKLTCAPLAALRWHKEAKSFAQRSQMVTDTGRVRNRYWSKMAQRWGVAATLLLPLLHSYYVLKVQAVKLALRGVVDFLPLRLVGAGRRNSRGN
jgi:glycosyltransferase involved in cell wall biosynthesis